MRFGSLFSGAGGLDLGMERAGHEVAFQCEVIEWRRQLLAQHFPDVPISPDVTELDADWLAEQGIGLHGEAVDMLVGGFPCQDISVAGRRKGLAGARSGLFFDAIRIADLVLGDGGWLVIENVPGLFSSNNGRDFGVVLASLAELGFHDLAWRVLDSRYVRVSGRPAVAQRRRRVFIVARRTRGRRSAEVLLEPEGGGGDFETGSGARPRVAATLSKGSSSDGVSRPGRRQEDDINIVSTLQGGAGKRGYRIDAEGAAGGHLVPGAVAHTLTSGGFDASEDGTGRGTPIVASPTDTDGDGEASGVPSGVDDSEEGALAWDGLNHRASDVVPTMGQNTGMCSGRAGVIMPFAQNQRDEVRVQGDGDSVGALASQPGMKQQTYVLDNREEALGIRTAQTGANGQGITPGETSTVDQAGAGAVFGAGGQSDRCAVDPLPDSNRYSAMGDAVTVHVAEWIGRRLNQYGTS